MVQLNVPKSQNLDNGDRPPSTLVDLKQPKRRKDTKKKREEKNNQTQLVYRPKMQSLQSSTTTTKKKQETSKQQSKRPIKRESSKRHREDKSKRRQEPRQTNEVRDLTILVWNVRGLNNADKQQEVLNAIKENDAHVALLTETKLTKALKDKDLQCHQTTYKRNGGCLTASSLNGHKRVK